MIEEVNGLVRPDFVQFIGDNVQDATESQFRLFDELRYHLAVPHRVLVGDHDIKDDPEAEGFRRHVGKLYQANSLGGYRWICLDTQEGRPVGLSAEQIAWFHKEVESAQVKGERVIVFQHNYPYQIWEDFQGPGIDAWREVVQSRRISAIVCGHTHYWQVANDGRNVCVATRSIGDPEGGPPGFTLLYVRDGDLAMRFWSVEDQGPIVLITHPRERLLATGPDHVVQAEAQLVVRTWSRSEVASVRGRIDDDGSSLELEPARDGLWACPLPAGSLAKGEHALEVVAHARDGSVGTHRIGFMVDPTGRYTAVPEVRPRVSSTAFC